jgi:hypothetical protein
MRHLFLLILLLIGVKNYANDTLTRAEVYNWAVGDTFDYKHYEYSSSGSGSYFSFHDTTYYQRFVITGIDWSVDSLSKKISRKRIFPTVSYDTLKLSYMNMYEIALDSVGDPPSGTYNCITDTVPDFWGFKANSVEYIPNSYYILRYKIFAKNLGNVLLRYWGGIHTYNFEDQTSLVYYSGQNGTYGRPYKSWIAGLQDPNSDFSTIKVYPTITMDKLNIKAANDTKGLIIIIYDMQGRAVKQVAVEHTDQVISIADLSSGVYVWRAVDRDNMQSTGRIVKE